MSATMVWCADANEVTESLAELRQKAEAAEGEYTRSSAEIGQALAEWQGRLPRGKFKTHYLAAGWTEDRVYYYLRCYKNERVPVEIAQPQVVENSEDDLDGWAEEIAAPACESDPAGDWDHCRPMQAKPVPDIDEATVEIAVKLRKILEEDSELVVKITALLAYRDEIGSEARKSLRNALTAISERVQRLQQGLE